MTKFKFEVGEIVLVGQLKLKRKIVDRSDSTESRGTNIYHLENYMSVMYEYELNKLEETK
jgi:hypothetical protein